MGRWRARAATTLLHSPVLFSSFLLLFNFRSFLSAASDTLTLEESLSINQTLVSVGQTFELGFFTSANRKKWYVGIWYKNLPTKTIVWVANRDAPVWSSSATLKLGDHANIVILDQGSSIRWSSNQSQATNPIIQLLNTGNLVVREMFDESPERYIWQSFDHPTDTLLPGQKLGWNLRTGLDRYLMSWRGVNDPSSGNFSCKLDPRGGPEMFLWNGNSGIIWGSGPWSGHNFLGMPNFSSVFEFTLFANEDEVYYMFQVLDDSVKSRLMVDPNGVARRYNWVPNSSVWNLYWSEPEDQCDDYNKCGSFGFCNASALFVCQCLQGFEPKNQQAWALRVGSDGCERKTKLECQSDGFQMFENMKVPRTSEAFVNRSISIEDCESLCRKDCNCTAYASSDVDDGVWSGCVIWSGDLINMRNYVQGGQNLYVRLAASDLVGNTSSEKGSKNTKKMMIRGSIAFGLGILLFTAGCIIWKRKTLQAMRKRKLQRKRWEFSVEANTEELELPLFDLDTIAMATDNFSSENELGQGGFGCVYKAVLVEGEELAVKRLSKNSGQGSEEFKNEVKLIAKLQHRNLVRLLGCCVERDEKIIIYEYLPNRSLDCFLFDEERSSLLNWQRRFDIICGVAQGLVYLHRDSIFRIIHRDLKASNILLDAEMQPKISDFGMARIFRGHETEAGNTRRVVGTYGYMSPEYAMDGIFSFKSDVFSFGVLMIEIVSGKKNQRFYKSNNELNLLEYAWKLWREGKATELLDPSIGDSYSEQEVLRCVQIGLLCVQARAADRPTIPSVVLMLRTESAASLQQPKLPGFSLRLLPAVNEFSSAGKDESFTVNQVTVTTLEAR